MKKVSSWFFLLMFFLIKTQNTYACSIKAPSLIIWNNEKGNSRLNNNIEFKNCSKDISDKVINLIKDYSGRVSRNTIIAETKLKNFTLKNDFVVQSLDDFLNHKLKLSRDWRIIDAKLNNKSTGIITKTHLESIDVDCYTCNNLGEKTIKVNIHDSNNKHKESYWIRAKLAMKTKVLVLEKNLNSSRNGLNPSLFKESSIYTTRPESLFQDKTSLIFYRINRPLKKGHFLGNNDLSPIDLVKIGRPVNISLKRKGLILEGTAIPSRSARLGDVIQLKNSRTQKNIIGKIVGFNKAEVNL